MKMSRPNTLNRLFGAALLFWLLVTTIKVLPAHIDGAMSAIKYFVAHL